MAGGMQMLNRMLVPGAFRSSQRGRTKDTCVTGPGKSPSFMQSAQPYVRYRADGILEVMLQCWRETSHPMPGLTDPLAHEYLINLLISVERSL